MENVLPVMSMGLVSFSRLEQRRKLCKRNRQRICTETIFYFAVLSHCDIDNWKICHQLYKHKIDRNHAVCKTKNNWVTNPLFWLSENCLTIMATHFNLKRRILIINYFCFVLWKLRPLYRFWARFFTKHFPECSTVFLRLFCQFLVAKIH